MKKMSSKELCSLNIWLCLPLILYAVYKNGYLIYEKDLIMGGSILKVIYLIGISVFIKLAIDLIKDHKIKIDYNLVSAILIPMIMPYKINYIVYGGGFLVFYILSLIFKKYLKFNDVAFIYLAIILLTALTSQLSFLTPLDEKYEFSFSFLDIFMGRSVGGIASTSILFSLLAYSILCFNFYYKKDIPLWINISYLTLAFIYFLIAKNDSLIINSEVIFASIFVAPLPISSPYKNIWQIIYGIVIGVLSFAFSILWSPIWGVYLAIFLISLGQFSKIRQNTSKVPKTS